MVLLATNKISYKIKPPAVDPVKEAGLVTTKTHQQLLHSNIRKEWKMSKIVHSKR